MFVLSTMATKVKVTKSTLHIRLAEQRQQTMQLAQNSVSL